MEQGQGQAPRGGAQTLAQAKPSRAVSACPAPLEIPSMGFCPGQLTAPAPGRSLHMGQGAAVKPQTGQTEPGLMPLALEPGLFRKTWAPQLFSGTKFRARS